MQSVLPLLKSSACLCSSIILRASGSGYFLRRLATKWGSAKASLGIPLQPQAPVRYGKRGILAASGSRPLFGWVAPGLRAPVARKDGFGDPYGWLRDGDEGKIKSYLDSENAYAKGVMKRCRDFEQALFHEMEGRVAEKEEGVPEFIEGWFYYMRTKEGSAFPIYCRCVLADHQPYLALLLHNS